jgi:hypothetical protein
VSHIERGRSAHQRGTEDLAGQEERLPNAPERHGVYGEHAVLGVQRDDDFGFAIEPNQEWPYNLAGLLGVLHALAVRVRRKRHFSQHGRSRRA